MDVFRLIASRKIEQAMDQGEFDHLAGAHQPLDLREEPFEDPSLRMAHRLLRNNGFAPRWIEEGKEIEAAVVALKRSLAEGRIGEAGYRQQAEIINRRILSFNLQAPASAHRLPV